MMLSLAIGCCLLFVTTSVHAFAMQAVFGNARLDRAVEWARRGQTAMARVVVVTAVVITLFLATIIESGAWAATFMLVESFDSASEALYFATVTYTTLGYGEIVLTGEWRLLSAMAAANGVMMFGWSTALIVAALQIVYAHENAAPSRQ